MHSLLDSVPRKYVCAKISLLPASYKSSHLNFISPFPSQASHQEARELVSRSVVGLVQWLQLDHKNLSSLTSQLRLVGQGDESGTTRTARSLKTLLDVERAAKAASQDMEGNGLNIRLSRVFKMPRNILNQFS